MAGSTDQEGPGKPRGKKPNVGQDYRSWEAEAPELVVDVASSPWKGGGDEGLGGDGRGRRLGEGSPTLQFLFGLCLRCSFLLTRARPWLKCWVASWELLGQWEKVRGSFLSFS